MKQSVQEIFGLETAGFKVLGGNVQPKASALWLWVWGPSKGTTLLPLYSACGPPTHLGTTPWPLWGYGVQSSQGSNSCTRLHGISSLQNHFLLLLREIYTYPSPLPSQCGATLGGG